MITLHIGTDKTGSTAIQKLLYYNRDVLKKYNWNYVDDFKLGGYNHSYLYSLLNKKKFLKLKEVLKNIDNKNNLLFSFEGFYLLPNEDINEFICSLKKICENIKILIYLRRQDNKVESGMLQNFKQGNLKALQNYNFNYKGFLDYYRIVKKWEEFVGKGNIIVRPYDKRFLSQKDSLIKDFFKYAMNLNFEEIKNELIIPKKDANPSIDAVSGYVLDFLGRMEVSNRNKFTIIGQLLGIENKIGKSKKSLFSKEERKKILLNYKESNEKLVKEYNLPKELFELEDKEYIKPSEDEVMNRLRELYKRKEYLLPLLEWEGKENFIENIKNNKILLQKGFYNIEEWGVWTKGNEISRLAFLVFRDFFNGNEFINIKIKGRYNNKDTKSYMKIYDNKWEKVEEEIEYKVSTDEISKNGGVVFIEFKHEHAKSPKELGMNEDTRILGVGIEDISFEEIV